MLFRLFWPTIVTSAEPQRAGFIRNAALIPNPILFLFASNLMLQTAKDEPEGQNSILTM